MSRKPSMSDLDAAAAMFDDPAGDVEREPLWSMINDRLQGRWLPMVVVGAVAAGLFGGLGYLSTGPKYMSAGAIHVAPRLSVTLTEIPETGELDHFNSFVNTQVQLIQGQRVLEEALRSDALKSIDWGGANPLTRLEEQLDVRSNRNSELITVAYECGEPKDAQAIVNAVIEAYENIYGRAGADQMARTLQRLKDLETQLSRQLRSLRTEMQTLSARYDTVDMHALRASMLTEIEQTERWMETAERLLAEREAMNSERVADDMAVEPTLEELEAIDPAVAEFRRVRDAARADFEFARVRYRPESSLYLRAKRRKENAERIYRTQFLDALQTWSRSGRIFALDVSSVVSLLSEDQVREQITFMEDRMATVRTEATQLAADLRTLEEIEDRAAGVETDLALAQGRIKQLEIEESAVQNGRITVAQWGSRPHSASSDGRFKRAVFGGGFGFALSFGAFFLLGTVDRRAFGVRQLERFIAAAGAPCLGVAPNLDGEHDDEAETAAHCMHALRNQIEARRARGDGAFVLAMTSPYQGDGKTSILLALGLSYASAGYRTLVIDGDLVGRSLTRQMGLRGEPGLCEALRSGPPDPTHIIERDHGLQVLPTGADGPFGAAQVRRLDLERTLSSLRDRFDVILIDTGPILGSLECTPITAAADAVALSVRRGRSCTRLPECIQRIETNGGRCLGVVLNCASRSEVDRYVSETSMPAPPPGEERVAGSDNALVRAMSTRPSTWSDDQPRSGAA